MPIGHRLRRTRLAVRLAVLCAALTAATVYVAFWALGREVDASTRQLVTDELTRTQRTVLQLQRRNLDQLISSASLITQSPSFGYILRTARVERSFGRAHRDDLARTLERELAKTMAELGKDLLVATDVDGHVFAAAADSAPPPRGLDLTKLRAVQRSLDPTAPDDNGALSVLRLGDAYYQVGVVPIVIDGFTSGTLLLGDRIDDAFIADLRSAIAGEVVIASAGSSLASTMPRSQATRVAAAGANLGIFHVDDDDYVMAASALGETQESNIVSLRLLQPLSPTVRTLNRALARDLAWYGALAVLVAAIGAGWLARSVLRPLRAFVEQLRVRARGGAAEPLAVADASPEIATLNDSFSQLMESLAAQRGELEQQSRELSSANDVLTEEIRGRERVERALHESEAQLRQSQKLEAIGTLAGGIAHDFNNLLTVISGFTQLAQMHAKRREPVDDDLRQVVDAADRASNLTSQLLAFSRKQVLQPRVLDLGEVVERVQGMLGRLIGAHIELRMEREEPLVRVKADPGQLEQVIINLAVNARDAMPFGGTITLATRNAARTAAGSPAAILSVADTGAGMDATVRERIFEPFFTTKEPGKGTGLGLSMVYGIVKQSEGTIDVASELGKGTTFTINFPAAAEPAEGESDERESLSPPRGAETILVAEDEEHVRALTRLTLEECGYTVLVASSGAEALQLARTCGRRIDLLLTDIIMPRMNGPQLVERFLAAHPAPSVVYMSGYADELILHLDVEPGTHFLHKPFTPLALARLIREVLDTERSPNALRISA